MRRWIVGAGAMLLVALAGCSSVATDSPPDDAGLVVALYQPRTGIALNRIAANVTNRTAEAVTVTAVRLISDDFLGAPGWSGADAVTLPPGKGSPDLRIALPTARCADGGAAPRVEVDWTSGDDKGTASVVPDDRFDFLTRSHATACFEAAVDAVAPVTLADLEGGDVGRPATLVIAVGAGRGSGSMTIESVESTTLLAPWNGVAAGQTLDLGDTVRGSDAERAIRVPLVPNRCDAHGLAEDKVGTLIPLAVAVDGGESGTLRLAPTDDLRGKMYAFYSRYCGL